MRNFIIGLIIGIVLLPAGAFLYIWLGYAPVATAAPPFPLERKLAGMALDARIHRDAPKNSPVQATEPNLLAGAKAYHDYCSMCHGAAGQPKTAAAKGMYPPPPQLLHGKGVTDDPPGETYWKVANGIRLTGMPSFRDSLNDEQMWQISQFLANANQLPTAVQQVSAEPPASK